MRLPNGFIGTLPGFFQFFNETLDPEGTDSSMQIDLVEKGRFHFLCQDGKTTFIQKEGHECSADVAIKILIAYRNGTKDWKALSEWKEVSSN
jgi:hypothetical protein